MQPRSLLTGMKPRGPSRFHHELKASCLTRWMPERRTDDHSRPTATPPNDRMERARPLAACKAPGSGTVGLWENWCGSALRKEQIAGIVYFHSWVGPIPRKRHQRGEAKRTPDIQSSPAVRVVLQESRVLLRAEGPPLVETLTFLVGQFCGKLCRMARG
jgi:hypothetical protein